MKCSELICIFVVALLLCASKTYAGEWITSQEGAKIWNDKPQDKLTCSWSGRRKEGYAEGNGLLVWFKDEKPVKAVSAVFGRGRHMGTIVAINADGSRSMVRYQNHPPTTIGPRIVGAWYEHRSIFRDAGDILGSHEFDTIVFHADGTFQRVVMPLRTRLKRVN